MRRNQPRQLLRRHPHLQLHPLPTTNETHYGNPAQGCLPDETTTALEGVPGNFCSPDCTSTACPTNLPAGVTADPQCALQGTSGTMSCALICDPLAANECGNAQCQPIQEIGICTYEITTSGGVPTHKSKELTTGITHRGTLMKPRRLRVLLSSAHPFGLRTIVPLATAALPVLLPTAVTSMAMGLVITCAPGTVILQNHFVVGTLRAIARQSIRSAAFLTEIAP